MAQPIVVAHHLIWKVYGWWLRNDPRGSCSRAIGIDLLKPLGDLHYGRKALQPASRDIRAFYEQTRAVPKHPCSTCAAAPSILSREDSATRSKRAVTPATRARSSSITST